MRLGSLFLAGAMGLMLAGCGGAGTGGPIVTPPPAPTPSPTPTPTPTPTPSSPPVTAVPFDSTVLATSGTFSESASRSIMNLGSSDAIVRSASVDRGALNIQYNAAQRTYSVSYGGDAATFRASDRLAERFAGEASYGLNLGSSNAQYLTVLSVPFISGSFASDIGYNRYVAQGYWQRNATGSGSSLSINFTSFVFGQQTTVAQMPRSGAAHWLVDIFGALSTTGSELRTVSGSGSFVVDFGAGAFVLQSNLSESQFLTIGGADGSLRLRSGGLLQSGGGFEGPLTYDGLTQLDGTLTGRFFGPDAAEVGATFEASGGTSWLSGAFTGQRSRFAPTSAGIPNITLGNILSPGYHFSQGSQLSFRPISATEADVSSNLGILGRVELGPDGVTSATDGQLIYYLNEAEQIAPPSAQFAVYHQPLGNYVSDVAVYRSNLSTQGISLTYLSFIKYSRFAALEGTILQDGPHYIVYYPFGVATAEDVMRARRGTASYTGVAYGDAAQRGLNRFSVSGTTNFAINFSAGSFSGDITLNGLEQGGLSQGTGRWTFAGALYNGYMPETALVGNLAEGGSGSVLASYYGPTGQEIGAPYSITIGTDPESPLYTRIAGIAIAKQVGP